MALILAGLFGLFLVATGAVFLVSPQVAVGSFGIDASHMADLPLAPAMGVRQIVFGLIFLVLALRREAAALGTALLLGAAVPVADWLMASKALGYSGAIRQLITLPVFLLLGLILVRR